MKENGGEIVTVIMTVYNGEKYLAASIDSVCNQTYKNIEFIIVNDGSTDSSYSIIKSRSQKNSSIKIINNEINLGQSASKNKAIKMATGKYIACLDADDISCIDRVEKQKNFLDSHPEIYLTGSGVNFIDHNNKKNNQKNKNSFHLKIKDIIKYRKWLCHSTIMFRNDKGDIVLYRNEIKYTQDKDLYLRILEQGKRIFVMKDRLVNYRVHEDQISKKNMYNQVFYSCKVMQLYLERKKSKGVDSLMKGEFKGEDDSLYNSELHNFGFRYRDVVYNFRDVEYTKKEVFGLIIKSIKFRKVYVTKIFPLIKLFIAPRFVTEKFKV